MMRRLLVPLLTILCTTAALSPISAAPANAAVSTMWTESAYVKVDQTSTKPSGAATSIAIDSARNESESHQVLLRHSAAFTITRVTFSSLTSGAQTLAASNLSYAFQQYYAMPGHGTLPDPLSNAATTAVASNKTQGVWITVAVPKIQSAGTYTGQIVISTTAGTSSVPISVHVFAATIPDAVDSTYIYSTWNTLTTDYADSDASVVADDITDHYGYTRYSAQWWALMADIAREQKLTRQNQIHIPMDVLLDGPTTLSSGTYTFNWSKFDQFVQTFIDNGSVQRLRGFPLLNALSTDKAWVLDQVGGQMRATLAPVGSTKAENWLDQYLPALRSHLDAKGWTSMWWQSISDEPGNDANYLWAANKFRSEFGAQARTMDAFVDVRPGLVGPNSVSIPLINTLQAHQAFYRAIQAAGREVWSYVCIQPDPADGWLNRWSTQPYYAPREIGWANFKYGVTGFYHWGYNAWGEGGYGTDEAGAGDGYIVYPDPGTSRVRRSVRGIATRDGNEDYELLKIVAAQDPVAALRIADPVVQAFDNFSDDVALLRQQRMALLSSASTPLPAAQPMEAEFAILVGSAAIGTVGGGYSGSGWVGGLDAAIGNEVKATFTGVTAGSRTLDLRYSNGTKTTSTLSLYVNGVFVRRVAFSPTGTWDESWMTASTPVTLTSGTNTLALRYRSGDGAVDVDLFAVR